MWLHCSSLTCQPRSRMPVVALSQHVAELAALPIPQQPFFLQRTLISDVTALFERSFYTNPSTTKKTKSPPWWKKGVSPLPDGTGFWLGSARLAFYCCYWSLSGLPNFLKLYLLAPGRNLGAWWSHVRGNPCCSSLSQDKDTLGNGSLPVFFCEGRSLPGVPGVTASPPADLKFGSASQVIYYNWLQKTIVLPARGMWKGARENEEVFQSQRAVFVPPYTTGLGLGNPVS